MSAFAATRRMTFNPIAAVAVVVLAVALGLAVLAFGKLALAGLFGLIAFALFIRYPIFGIYCTTVLLLLAGGGNIIAGGVEVSIPVTGAKLCGAAALAAWLTHMIFRKERWTLTWEVIWALAFFVWGVVGVLFAEKRGEQMPEWIRLGTQVAFFAMIVDVLSHARSRGRDLHRFVILIAVCGVFSSLFALSQYFLPSFQVSPTYDMAAATLGVSNVAVVDPESLSGEAAVRVSGRALHSNWLAFALLITLPLNAYWFATCKTWKGRIFVCVAVMLEIMALVLTFTRTGFVVGVAIAVILALKGLLKANPYRLVALALIAVLGWTALPPAYKERVLKINQYTSSKSVNARQELQRAAMDFLTESPVYGVGLGGFGFHLLRETSTIANMMNIAVTHYNWQPIFIGEHNLFLQIGCETGMIGLILFLLLVILIMRNLHNAQKIADRIGDTQAKALTASLQISMVAFLLSSVFLHALQQKIWWIVAAAAVAASIYVNQLAQEKDRAASSTEVTQG